MMEIHDHYFGRTPGKSRSRLIVGSERETKKRNPARPSPSAFCGNDGRVDLMNERIILSGVMLSAASGAFTARLVSDLKHGPPVLRPACKSGAGPRVTIDEAHPNFHTAERC
jgi:hypothetical protein